MDTSTTNEAVPDGVDSSESDITKRHLDWCRSHRLVKCTEYTVPDGILPRKCRGILIDIKVQGGKRFSGPDDKLYAANEDLRRRVARGNTILELQTLAGSRVVSTEYHFFVFALRKFSGGMGDEDEDEGCQNMWHKYFIKPIESATRVVATEKANGEAAHVACRSILQQTYFCIGSKNVHMLLRNREDIAIYTDSRFLVARVVAEAFFRNYVENMEVNQAVKLDLYAFLQRTRSTGVFELLQPQSQHVVDLGYLERPELRFICWADNYAAAANGDECDSLCLAPPDKAIEEARGFGLATIEYEVIGAAEAEEYMARIRAGRDYEGKVLYFTDANDRVLGLIKKKTAWYIVLRAIREKSCSFVCAKTPCTKAEMLKKLTRRLREIQGWLGFSDEFLAGWERLGGAFVLWILAQARAKNHFGVRSQFPQLWKRFLAADGECGRVYEELEYS